MQEQSLHIRFRHYDGPADLPADDRTLLDLARQALENSYSPYSQFKVGAAVRMSHGETLTGSNYENAAYPMCICAEQGLLAAAASRFPEEKVMTLAVTVRNTRQVIDRPAAPCGACRQVICETEQRNRQPIRVIVQGEIGPVLVFESCSDLLPFSFGGTYLISP